MEKKIQSHQAKPWKHKFHTPTWLAHPQVGWDRTPELKRSTAAAAKSLQSCPTLCDPWDGSPQGSPIPGILQARTLEWVAISFSNAWKWKVKVKSLSRVWVWATPWTAAHQAPPSVGFSRQECWSGCQREALGHRYSPPSECLGSSWRSYFVWGRGKLYF